jgi:hypothetical protein
MGSVTRRRVDWDNLPLSENERPRLLGGSSFSSRATLLTALGEMLACNSIDAILHLAVDIAKERALRLANGFTQPTRHLPPGLGVCALRLANGFTHGPHSEPPGNSHEYVWHPRSPAHTFSHRRD